MLDAEYLKDAIGIQKVLQADSYNKCKYDHSVNHLYNDMMEHLPCIVAHHIYDLCFMNEVFKDEHASDHIKHELLKDHMNCRMMMASK